MAIEYKYSRVENFISATLLKDKKQRKRKYFCHHHRQNCVCVFSSLFEKREKKTKELLANIICTILSSYIISQLQTNKYYLR